MKNNFQNLDMRFCLHKKRENDESHDRFYVQIYVFSFDDEKHLLFSFSNPLSKKICHLYKQSFL